jgi:hypothetical protein
MSLKDVYLIATNDIAHITLEILDAYLSCMAYLRLAGQEGIKSDYEAMLIESSRALKIKAVEKIHDQYSEHTLAKGIALTR